MYVGNFLLNSNIFCISFGPISNAIAVETTQRKSGANKTSCEAPHNTFRPHIKRTVLSHVSIHEFRIAGINIKTREWRRIDYLYAEKSRSPTSTPCPFCTFAHVININRVFFLRRIRPVGRGASKNGPESKIENGTGPFAQACGCGRFFPAKLRIELNVLGSFIKRNYILSCKFVASRPRGLCDHYSSLANEKAKCCSQSHTIYHGLLNINLFVVYVRYLTMSTLIYINNLCSVK